MARTVWLLSKREHDRQSNVCVAVTFRSIYKLALFELQIADPNLNERTARLTYRKNKELWLWNREEFDSFEEAMWSPIGRIARIEQVRIRKT